MTISKAVSVATAVKARVGRPVLLNLRPLRDRRADAAGRRVVCGADTTFAFNSWTVPDELDALWADPSVSLANARRESSFCRSCCSNLRVRRDRRGPPRSLRERRVWDESCTPGSYTPTRLFASADPLP